MPNEGGPSNRPFVVGIAGGTCAGKTTLANHVRETLSGLHGAAAESLVAYVPYDAYYRDLAHLSVEERSKVNFDHPDSLEGELVVAHIRELLEGRSVDVPCYDFSRHTRVPEKVTPTQSAPIIIVEGILSFVSEELRGLMDLKIFVGVDDDVRFIRRLQRDTVERGRTSEQVVHQYGQTVKPMHDKYVVPTLAFADVIVPTGGFNKQAAALIVARLSDILSKSSGH